MAAQGHSFDVLQPAGQVGDKERSLLLLVTILAAAIVIPVFALTAAIVWRYREGNSKSKYSPELDGNVFAEFTWWVIPLVIITVLAVIAWNSTHSLDPNKRLVSANKTMTIQVVALEWRWLFIYPEQGVASLNYVNIPANTPIDFEITADAPMNSFWIPKLGGQIYAMPGMTTHLNLVADKIGTYRGSSANLSGDGFAGMDFDANSMGQDAFDLWAKAAKKLPASLSTDEYLSISKPSKDKHTTAYASVSADLYDRVVMKYMMPGMELK